MPRVSHKIYYIRHQFLHKVWLQDQRPFAVLEPKVQAELHRYYQPAKELTDRELHAHRMQVTKRDPSLPNRAGKIYIRLEQILRNPAMLPGGVIQLEGNILVPKPPPEVRRLARGLIAYARWRLAK